MIAAAERGPDLPLAGIVAKDARSPELVAEVENLRKQLGRAGQRRKKPAKKRRKPQD